MLAVTRKFCGDPGIDNEVKCGPENQEGLLFWATASDNTSGTR